MSTDTAKHHLDRIAGKAAMRVEGQLVPELWQQEEAYVLCFLAPRTADEFPWLFKITATMMVKINVVHYIMPPDSVEAPATRALEFEGVDYIIHAQAFKVDVSSANFDHELTSRLRDMFFEAIQLELLVV